MNKRYLHHVWTKIRPIRFWYFFGAFLFFLVLGVAALRQNNLNMIKLRDAVYQTDKDNGDVEAALRNLREYVYSHMNTNLTSGNNSIKPPIQLKYRYERLAKVEHDRVAAINAKVYNDAQNICEQLYPQSFSGGPRVPCIQDYVSKNGAKEQAINDSLYKFDFVSPRWTPDLAGWSLVLAVFFLVLAVLRFGLERWVKAELKKES